MDELAAAILGQSLGGFGEILRVEGRGGGELRGYELVVAAETLEPVVDVGVVDFATEGAGAGG